MNKPLALLLALTAACTNHYEEMAAPAPAATTAVVTPLAATAVDIDAPGPIQLDTVVSANWSVPLSGLLDLNDPKTKGFHDGPTSIVLSVHVIHHPQKGLYVVDTGVPRDAKLKSYLVTALLSGVEPKKSLADIVGTEKLAGVFFTHMHIDHVLGLPDVPMDVPILSGPGELEPVPGNVTNAVENAILGKTFSDLVAGHDRQTFDPTKAAPLGPIDKALDVFGDGSLYALATPGHTEGSMAYLVRTTTGPVLLTGDTSHTIWGWEHDVVPGFFTENHDENVKSLAALRALAAQHPAMKIVVGHETDGVGTGVQD